MVIINQSIFLWKHLLAHNISTDEDPRLRIGSFAIVNLRDVSTKLYFKYIVMNRNTVNKSYLRYGLYLLILTVIRSIIFAYI